MRECSRSRLKAVQSAAHGSYPDGAGAVLYESLDSGIAEAIWFYADIIISKAVPIITVQPLLGPKPHKTLPVFYNRLDSAPHEAILYRQVIKRMEGNVRSRTLRGSGLHQQEEQDHRQTAFHHGGEECVMPNGPAALKMRYESLSEDRDRGS